MRRSMDSTYGSPYGRRSTVPPPSTFDGYDSSYNSYSNRSGVVGDAWRVPANKVKDRRDEYTEFVDTKPYQKQHYGYGYGSTGTGSPYRHQNPGEYGDYSSKELRKLSGGDNYKTEKSDYSYKTEFGNGVPSYVSSPRPSHAVGSLSTPTSDIGMAMELLKETATVVQSTGGYGHHQQATSRYVEHVSAVNHYPVIMPHTMDPSKRYGNINFSSRGSAMEGNGNKYY